MTFYDFTTLTIAADAMATSVATLEHSVPSMPGRLLGCWSSDVGALNRIMVLRGFESAEAVLQAREALAVSDKPFGIGSALEAMESGTYKLFPFLPDIEPAQIGRCYELRMYSLKFGQLAPSFDAWQAALPERTKLSHFVGAMYALDGTLPRFLNIWAYESADARARVRAEAVAMKIWPPKGGPQAVTPQMTSTLAVPAGFSPLR